MILRPVGADPVNASLSTPAWHGGAPVPPNPVTTWNTGCSGTTSLNASASHTPTAGVYSLGLKTTALPAASAYAVEPIGGDNGEVPGPVRPAAPSRWGSQVGFEFGQRHEPRDLGRV